MYLIVLVLLLLFAVFLIFFRRQSPSGQRGTQSRSGIWHDDGSDLSILPVASPQSDLQISSDYVHEPSYSDSSTGKYATDNVDHLVSGGNVDYGTSGHAGGDLGSAMADAIDWGGGSSGNFDSGSSDFGGGSSSDGGSSDGGSS